MHDFTDLYLLSDFIAKIKTKATILDKYSSLFCKHRFLVFYRSQTFGRIIRWSRQILPFLSKKKSLKVANGLIF